MSWYSWSVGADVSVGAVVGNSVGHSVGLGVLFGSYSVGQGVLFGSYSVGHGVLSGSYSVGQGVGTPGACRRRPVGSSRTPPPAVGADGEELGEEVGVPAAWWHQHPTARIATAAPRRRGARIS